MKNQVSLLASTALALAAASLPAQNLLVDFSSTNQDAGPNVQTGYQAYNAGHEVIADFITRSFPAFGTSISITPAWPNTVDNRVQQMIDRGAGNDANWNDGNSDLQLITDFLGIDTRTGSGGNGNWDGTNGTPTHMTLTLGNIPAGTYGWTSFHHDTEHVHGNFQIELSTDGGATFADLGSDFYMSDSTPGGSPDSATNGAGGTQVGPAAATLTSTATFQIEATGADSVVLRFTPLSGVLGNAVHNQIWGINGFELAALGDADGDDLADNFEQSIIDADPDDAINTIEDVLPGDDFDNDGASNAEEQANATNPTAADSDGDGLLDGVETANGTFVDANDTGTNPNNDDSDNDGINDGDEVAGTNGFATDPTKEDTDGDGFNDDTEIAQDTNPSDPNDFPQPSGTSILFVGGQPGPTQGADAAVMTFLEETYGPQNVTYMQASVAQTGDELAYSALILSSTFGSGDARGKFQDSPVATLNWEEALLRSTGGEFAISEGRPKENTEHTATIAIEHPITSGFPVGEDVQLTNGAAEFWWATAPIAPGALTLVQEDTDANRGWITIVDQGDELLTGQPAAGRRVMLGITDATFNFFTDDARTLFKQSVDWLLGISDGPRRIRLTEVSQDATGDTLTLKWESQPGKLYTLRSEADPSVEQPLNWSVFDDNADLTATPPENTLTIAMPTDPTRLFVVEEFDAPPVILFTDDLESGAPGWTTLVNDDTENTQWELGTPSGTTGPIAGAEGSSNAWSTNLGDYGNDSDISLRSPAIDMSGVSSAELTFEAFRDADGFGDPAVVRFLRAADFTQVGNDIEIDMTTFDSNFTTIRIDVPAAAIGENIIIEWNFVSDASGDAFSGLTIDDILVTD